MVPVLALNHTAGGLAQAVSARPRALVVSVREVKISSAFRLVYRQLTDRPARLSTASAPSRTRPRSLPHRASPPVRPIVRTVHPSPSKAARRWRPMKPLAPAMTTVAVTTGPAVRGSWDHG